MPTTVLTNCHIVTMDRARPTAQAAAIEDGIIHAVGSEDEVLACVGYGARFVDLGGRLVTPGFNDCHMHLLPYGLDLSLADLSPSAGVMDVNTLVDALCSWSDQNPHCEWVMGSRYDQNIFPGAAHPTRQQLDRAFPNRPVYITQTSKHAASCNSVALKIAGITRDTVDPPGAQIGRDDAGEPTGTLFEGAMDLVSSHIPMPDQPTMAAAIVRANEELVKHGITSASDMNLGWRDMSMEVAAYGAAMERGAPIRVTLFPHAPSLGSPDAIPTRADFARDYGLHKNGSSVRLGAIKLFSDGALTVRTAALREPYVDGSGDGLLLHAPEELKAYILQADRGGWQVAVHAIGDRAIDLTLDCFAACNSVGRRHRIEHAMMLGEGLIGRFFNQQILPIVQPEFLSRLGDAYVLGLGLERAAKLNPTASLQRAGVGTAFSSDCPIVPGAPLDGVRAASRRTTRSGTVLGHEERIDPMDGLRNYTRLAAYSSFDENVIGTISRGMRADFAILNCDPPIENGELTDEHLDTLSVAATVCGGECAFGSQLFT